MRFVPWLRIIRAAAAGVILLYGVAIASHYIAGRQDSVVTISKSPTKPIFQDGYITITSGAKAGWFTYEDRADAFHFQFPRPLYHRDGDVDWGLQNALDATLLDVLVDLGPNPPLPPYRQPITKAHDIRKEKINGESWTSWSTEGGVGYYTYQNDEAISFQIYAPNSHVTFSDSDAQILKQIVSTFGFDDLTSRLDHKIADVALGQRFGNLIVARVESAAGPNARSLRDEYGEIAFRGELTVSGGSTDESAMHGEWDGLFGLDASSTALIPKIGPLVYHTPIVASPNLFQTVQLDKVPRGFDPDSGKPIVSTNLKEMFRPGGGAPTLSADFVKSE